ncbi:MAG: TrbI/VirB10 family protein [Coxiellaceae bacterium]|nr:TrbI/VirB10 family protein [Coxiellaceae bacterium]
MSKKDVSYLSKVTSSKKNKYAGFYWLMVTVLIVTVIYFVSSSRAKITNIQQKTLLASRQYQESLNSNLSRLQQLDHAKPKIQNLIDSMTNRIDKAISKAYTMRQNAPTSMYSNSERSDISQQGSSQVASIILAGRGRNTQFANSDATTTTVTATRIAHPDYTIASGEFLHAVLETAVNSDLPGMVRAVVSTPAYSYTGEHVLIDAGSRLVGQYTASVVRGQQRVMVIWNRVIRPDGVAIQLNSPGTDALGRAGQTADAVNTHFMARFGQATLLSLLGAGAASVGVANSDRYNSVAQYRSSISESMQQAAKQSLQDTVSIKPTIHVYQGAKINVFVAHDLSLYDVLKSDYK